MGIWRGEKCGLCVRDLRLSPKSAWGWCILFSELMFVLWTALHQKWHAGHVQRQLATDVALLQRLGRARLLRTQLRFPFVRLR